MHREAALVALTVSGVKCARVREAVWVGQGGQTRAWQRSGPAAGHAGSPVNSRRAGRRQSDDGRGFRAGAGATAQTGSCHVHHRAGAAALRRPYGGSATSARGPMLQLSSPQRAPVNKRTTMPPRRCGPMILASRMSSGRCIRPSVGPARPSPSSFELMRSPWRRALLTWSMNMRIQEMTLF